jgi:hypothetical protein
MRFLLTLLAVANLLAIPVAASAAQVACGHAAQEGTMSGMDMPGMDQSNAQTTPAVPCFNQTAHKGQPNKSCAQSCAATSVVVAALPTSPATTVFVSFPVEEGSLRIVSTEPYEPTGPERPPKSIA